MGKYKYSKTEQQINDVLKYHDDELKKLKAARPSTSELDRRIQESSAVNVENQDHKTFAGRDAEKIKKVYPYRKMRRKSWR